MSLHACARVFLAVSHATASYLMRIDHCVHDCTAEHVGCRLEYSLEIGVGESVCRSCRCQSEYGVAVADTEDRTDAARKTCVSDLSHAFGLEIFDRCVGCDDRDRGVGHGVV